MSDLSTHHSASFSRLALMTAMAAAAVTWMQMRPVSAQQEQVVRRGPDFVSSPVAPEVTIPAAEAPLAADPTPRAPRNTRRSFPRPGQEFVPMEPPVPEVDALLAVQEQSTRELSRAVTNPLNFNGQGYSSVSPSDASGAVGPSHFVQIINSSSGARVTIYNKSTGAVVTGPFLLSSLGATGNCASGLGDGIALYDRLANRWLLSEFGPSSAANLCVYVSQTNDPTGSYHRYNFTVAQFPDYPKYAVWPTGYFVTSNEGSGSPVYAMDRSQMLSGASATIQKFTAPDLAGFPFQALTPADFDGTQSPPSGSPAYFMRHRDDEVHNSGSADSTRDFLEIWQLQPDFVTPANSVFSGPTNVGVTSFDSNLCGLSSFQCFPQPNGIQLDPLREVIMYRLQYRNFGSHASMVGNFVVDVNGADRGGIRWFELRKSGSGTWTLYQEGTYSPDANHRWMGAIAMDQSGNILLTYSVASTSLHAGLRFTGRDASSALGTMPTAETVIVNGSASQSGNTRWGDYHELTLDPSDDCTFWFTGNYLPTSQWATRVASLKFDGCGGGVSSTASSITYGNYVPANSVVDAGERVTLSVTLQNNGASAISNLVATLQNTGGVSNASGPQSYGSLAAAASGTKDFRFTAGGACGAALTATVQLQDNSASLGSIPLAFTIGTPASTSVATQAFDGVTAPNLPSGWTTSNSGAVPLWVTSATSPASSPNAAFTSDPGTVGEATLVMPAFTAPSTATTLTFSNFYNTESRWDGMVLEISVNGGSFSDVVSAGGTFNSGGYSATLLSSANPLSGRSAWTGNSSTYVTTSVTLPSSALGQSVRFRWRMGSDESVSGVGVRIDNISVTSDGYTCASPQAFTDATLAAAVTPVRSAHLSELRARIDAQRVRFGLSAFSWTNGTVTSGVTVIQAVHITEMRTALAAAYAQTALTAPSYTDTTLTNIAVKTVHITQLRTAVAALEDM